MDNEKDKRIFREKSIEQLSEPDQLTSYLRVTGPGVWFILVGIIVLMIGILVWASFGRISSTVHAPTLIVNGEAACYVLEEDLDPQMEDVKIMIGDETMTASASEGEAVTLDASYDPALYESGYLSPGRHAVILKCRTNLEDGFYDASVITQTLKPISLLFTHN